MSKTQVARQISVPISDEVIKSLHVGDSVSLNGVILTGRDRVHKWIVDTFIDKKRTPSVDDEQVYHAIKTILKDGVIYHCGPVVVDQGGSYRFIAAGPTTSMREEMYEAQVIKHFNIKAVIGKGGMGEKTAAACREGPAVYLHAVGGAAAFIARSVKEVKGVYKLDFGMPEAMWLIRVENFPLVVTIDSHGESLHQRIRDQSGQALNRLNSA